MNIRCLQFIVFIGLSSISSQFSTTGYPRQFTSSSWTALPGCTPPANVSAGAQCVRASDTIVFSSFQWIPPLPLTSKSFCLITNAATIENITLSLTLVGNLSELGYFFQSQNSVSASLEQVYGGVLEIPITVIESASTFNVRITQLTHSKAFNYFLGNSNALRCWRHPNSVSDSHSCNKPSNRIRYHSTHHNKIRYHSTHHNRIRYHSTLYIRQSTLNGNQSILYKWSVFWNHHNFKCHDIFDRTTYHDQSSITGSHHQPRAYGSIM